MGSDPAALANCRARRLFVPCTKYNKISCPHQQHPQQPLERLRECRCYWTLKRRPTVKFNRPVNVQNQILLLFIVHVPTWMTIDRVQRLKDARAEASKEIESLKQQKIAEYGAFEMEVALSLREAVEEYDKKTTLELEEVQKTGQDNREQVVQFLLETVTKVQPHMHLNASLRIKEERK